MTLQHSSEKSGLARRLLYPGAMMKTEKLHAVAARQKKSIVSDVTFLALTLAGLMFGFASVIGS